MKQSVFHRNLGGDGVEGRGGAAVCRLAAGAVAEFVDGGVGGAFAGFGCVDAFAAVVDHALDDGLAKAHDIIVVDGGSGCEEAIGKALLDQD